MAIRNNAKKKHESDWKPCKWVNSNFKISAYPDLATQLLQILTLPRFNRLLCQKGQFTLQPCHRRCFLRKRCVFNAKNYLYSMLTRNLCYCSISITMMTPGADYNTLQCYYLPSDYNLPGVRDYVACLELDRNRMFLFCRESSLCWSLRILLTVILMMRRRRGRRMWTQWKRRRMRTGLSLTVTAAVRQITPPQPLHHKLLCLTHQPEGVGLA